MKGKLYLLMAAAVMLGTGVVACGGTGAPSSSSNVSIDYSSIEFNNVTIKYGNPITGSDGEAMRKLVAQFNEEFKGKIFVDETFQSETAYYEALENTIPMKTAPDVALVHSYKVQSYANRNMINDLGAIIDGSGIDLDREDYITSVYDACQFDSKQYAIPLDIHTIVLYYNQDLLDKYNDGKVPTNRAELIEAAKKMPNTQQGGYGLPLATAWPSEYIYTTALYQNGGVEIKDDYNPGFNTPEGKKAMKMVTDLVHVEKISPLNVATDADLQMFNSGKAMFHINGDWMLNSITSSAEETGINFGVTSLSNMFVDEETETSDQIASRSHVFVLPQGRNNPEKLAASTVFIKWMTEHASTWAEVGHVPASNIARETEEYKALPYHKYFGDIDSFRINAPSPYYYEAYSPIFQYVTQAMSNPNLDLDKAFNDAEQEGIELVELAKGI